MSDDVKIVKPDAPRDVVSQQGPLPSGATVRSLKGVRFLPTHSTTLENATMTNPELPTAPSERAAPPVLDRHAFERLALEYGRICIKWAIEDERMYRFAYRSCDDPNEAEEAYETIRPSQKQKQEALEKLMCAVRAGLADSERLDWLEAKRASGVYHVSSGGASVWCLEDDELGRFTSLRQAIDAARDKGTVGSGHAPGDPK